jgi:hypothetical protein
LLPIRPNAGATFAEHITANHASVANALDQELTRRVRRRELMRRELLRRGLGRLRIAAYQGILAGGHRLVRFVPAANDGRGSWVELVGRLGPDTVHVGLLVPGGRAYLTDPNFRRYHDRAVSFVRAAPHGSLAVIVWTDDGWPKGWLRERRRTTVTVLARRLVEFSEHLRAELALLGGRARVTAIGHSYGGAVLGVAERYGLDVDRVLHVASAGMGVRAVDGLPDRPRYVLTAPGDWIGYVQGVPGLGHGADPNRFPGVIRLDAGALPAEPRLPDELGVPLGSRAGTPIRGRHAHSLVFVPYSDAWWHIYRVVTGGYDNPHGNPHRGTDFTPAG